MKKILRFSRFFLPAAIMSGILTIFGITGYVVNNGFNLGVDFQAGLIQEVRFAPAAFTLTWSGTANAILSYDSNNIHIVVSGSGIENRTFTFPFSEYNTLASISQAMMRQIEGLEVSIITNAGISTQWLLFSVHGSPYLGSVPYVVHYLDPSSDLIDITQVRAAMDSFDQGVSVQSMGQPRDRHFMIRVQDKDEGHVRPEEVTKILEDHFGSGEVVVLRSDYVGSRFSKNLTDQAGLLVALTLLLILVYSAFRFKFQYAVSLVLAIIYDALIIIGFVAWTRMEFTTSTIAAILTIIGYSTNDTIVVFDRIRETRRLYPDDSFVDVLNRALTETLGRTIITTVTTLLAVMSLFIFTTGSMKDFALALMVGMLTGVLTTTFLASGILSFMEAQKDKREKRKLVKG